MMDLINSAVQQQQAQTQMQVGVSMLKKTIDNQKMLGEMIVGLIDASTMQTPSKSVDSGKNFDVYA